MPLTSDSAGSLGGCHVLLASEQAGGDECLRVAASDVRLRVIIASEGAAGERHPGRSEETKQQPLLYLERQHVLLNIWPNASFSLKATG